MSSPKPRRRWWRIPLVVLLLLVVVPFGLFTLNGTVLSAGERASGSTSRRECSTAPPPTTARWWPRSG